MTAERTADTSIVVPALSKWHEHHERARAAISDVDRLPAHVLVESYSVLTRLPQGLALSPETATRLIGNVFPGPPLVLDSSQTQEFLARAESAGIRGGAIYDALVGWTAVQAGAELLTRDARAAGGYRALGVSFRPVV